MKISKREKTLLCVLGFILVSALYYQFGYKTLNNMVLKKTQEKQEIKQKYDSAVSTIDSMEQQQAKVKILNAKISDEAKPFYPTISQEHIILEMDKLIKDSGLEGGMTFKEVEVKGVDVQKKSDKDKDLPESSMQGIADEYNNKYGSKSDENSNVKDSNNTNDNSQTSNSNNKSSSNNNNTNNSSSSSNSNNGDNPGTSASKGSNTTNDKSKDKGENTITQLQLNVDFNGSYKNVVKFLELLRKYDKKMPAYAINMSTKNLTDVKGSVNMMIYAIPKIDDSLGDYLTWKLNNAYGKDQPFTVNSASGTGIKSDQDTSDFVASVRSINSDLPTVTIGKSNDALRTTYAYSVSNTDTEVEMILTKENGNYYYKYKTKDGSIPKDYNGLGNQFVLNGDNIQINIQSENRVNSDDRSGLKLKIINNTDKLANVNVAGDDKNNPRVSIDGDSTNINVNQK